MCNTLTLHLHQLASSAPPLFGRMRACDLRHQAPITGGVTLLRAGKMTVYLAGKCPDDCSSQRSSTLSIFSSLLLSIYVGVCACSDEGTLQYPLDVQEFAAFDPFLLTFALLTLCVHCGVHLESHSKATQRTWLHRRSLSHLTLQHGSQWAHMAPRLSPRSYRTCSAPPTR